MNSASNTSNLYGPLAALRQQYAKPEVAKMRATEPQSAERLLILCCSLYIKSRKLCYENYMEAGQALFISWYSNQPKFDNLHTRQYPSFKYPDVCTCGAKYSGAGSTLRSHCSNCQGNNNSQIIDRYEIQRISRLIKVDQCYLESIFAKVIYHDYF